MVSQTRVTPVAVLWVLLLAATHLMQQCAASYEDETPYRFKLVPGSEREFRHYGCGGRFSDVNRELYDNLSDVCIDCKNVFRYTERLGPRCMDNCFDNWYFNSCVIKLQPNEVKKYKKMRLAISG